VGRLHTDPPSHLQNIARFIGIDLSICCQAYYKLSLSLHPDKNPGDSEAQRRFAKIGAAYEILKDDDRRESYDYVLAHPEQVLYNTARYYQTYYGPKSVSAALFSSRIRNTSARRSSCSECIWGHIGT
jgi:curved DNA-binding protein CbpA